ncbi:uncharacterized protein LOC116033129 [Ipomoea triloba]|uniref:uncharacterized protein LOC116033129 n=1 Tax=Ipomoea triloba TaxID=35885 RepID=UPI00125DB4CE|nr:uncharacterized protein LOC116033129 [Ipomoea triloba]
MKKKHGEEEAMDWYSWLSKSSSLEPSHVYEYGLVFTRNELKDEDLRHFNHEFLQSMGISVAKHRLEILKLARNKEARGLSTFVNKTKKLLAKMVPHHHHHHHQRKVNKLMMNPYQERGLLRPGKPRLLKSGPLDRKVQVPVQEKMAITTTRSSLSGPLDANKVVQERLMLPSCSPLGWGGKMVFPTISQTKSGPLDATWTLMSMSPTTNHNNPRHSLWSLMFQDMKPT